MWAVGLDEEIGAVKLVGLDVKPCKGMRVRLSSEGCQAFDEVHFPVSVFAFVFVCVFVSVFVSVFLYMSVSVFVE